MKIIFLDVDGVLNSKRYDVARTSTQGNIDETRLPLLKELVETTGAKIVLSSSWRKHWDKVEDLRDEIGKELDETFRRFGLNVYDKTPFLDNKNRAEEVRLWMTSQNETVSRFVIFDDVPFGWGDDLYPYLVRTDYLIGRGLERRHIETAIRLLNK